MRSTILPIVSAIALASVTAAAAAEEIVITRTPAPSATVSLAGLNLDSPTGFAAGQARIEAASAALCLTNVVEPVSMRLARRRCYRAAVSDGYRQLDRMVALQIAMPTDAATAILTKSAK